jgi:hypothetical protein
MRASSRYIVPAACCTSRHLTPALLLLLLLLAAAADNMPGHDPWVDTYIWVCCGAAAVC